MSFLRTLLHKSRGALAFMILLGLFNSVLNAGLLIFINNTILDKDLPFLPEYEWQVFVGIVLSSLLVARFFQTYMIKLTNNILYSFEMGILKKLRFASFEDFESLGSEKAYTAINDTKVLANVPEVILNALNSLIIMGCCFGYLFWISPVGGGLVVAAMMVLLVVYLVRNYAIEKQLNEARDLQNTYYKYFSDMLRGFKELKMSLVRNNNIFDNFLIKNRQRTRDIQISTSTKYMDNELTGSYSWYIILGITMFVLPSFFNLNAEKTTAFLVTILYMIGPVAILVTLIPTYTAVKISAQRLNLFEHLLDSIDTSVDIDPSTTIEKFESIRFEDVSYEYSSADRKQTFYLEPLNLEINKGELIFVVGGNGSGKSTFAKLLTGLYRPYTGNILFNGEKISNDEHYVYSNQMAAIFTDNYLFTENYDDFDLSPNNPEFAELTEFMNLTGILNYNEEENKIDNYLSKGQQKRLALIYALMEKKDLLVLDEWAAEQDPRFREYFYKTVVQELQKRGKTVVAITHDDEYYSCASRIIKFNFGKIVMDSANLARSVSNVVQQH